MYVSIERDEQFSLVKTASKQLGARQGNSFVDTLEKRKEISDYKKQDYRLSKEKRQVKVNDRNRKRNADISREKVDFANKNRIERQKINKTKDKFDKKDVKTNEELGKVKEEKSENQKSSKENHSLENEKTSENKTEVSKKLLSENENIDKNQFESILNNFVLNLEKQLSTSDEGINLKDVLELLQSISSENGKIDLTENLSLKDFKEVFAFSDNALKETEEVLNKLNEFSEEILKALENQDTSKDKLKDLMEKLNVISAKVENAPVEDSVAKTVESMMKTSKIIDSAVVSEKVEEIKNNENSQNLENNDLSNSQGREKQSTNTIKTSENLVIKTNSVKSENVFQAKLESIDAKIEDVKNNLDIQKQIKSNMKTEIFDQIKNHIAKQSVKQEHSEMIIKLRPEELGKVELKIEVHKDQVIAKMNVASQVVKEAIESNLDDLKSSLKDKGFDVMSFDVDVKQNSEDSKEQSSGKKRHNIASEFDVNDIAESVSEIYIKTLDALEQGSTFEELA